MLYICIRKFDVIDIVGNFLRTKQDLNQANTIAPENRNGRKARGMPVPCFPRIYASGCAVATSQRCKQSAPLGPRKSPDEPGC